MTEISQLTAELRARLIPVTTVAVQWEQAVAANMSRVHPVLPVQYTLGQPVHLQPLSASAIPTRYRSLLEKETLKSVQTHYWRVALQVACNESGLLRTLSSLAHDAALGRTLIDSADCFDVSGRSILVAVGLANYIHVLDRWSKQRDNSLLMDNQLKQSIVWPLQAADHYFSQWRPGDLWWMDVVSRTARTMAYSVTLEFRDRNALKVIGPLMLEFVRRCTLGKLLEVASLGADLARQAKYDLWPGLGTLAADPGATSLRNMLCTELIGKLAADQTGLQQVAFLQMLSVLSESGSEHAWSRRILVARLFWELLEFDAELLYRLKKRGASAASIGKAISFLRAGLTDSAPPDKLHLELRFLDVWASLRAWEESLDSVSSLSAMSGSKRARKKF